MSDKFIGMKLICHAPKGEQIVSMIHYMADIYVATNKQVYRLVNDELKKVDFVPVGEDGP